MLARDYAVYFVRDVKMRFGNGSRAAASWEINVKWNSLALDARRGAWPSSAVSAALHHNRAAPIFYKCVPHKTPSNQVDAINTKKANGISQKTFPASKQNVRGEINA